MGYERLTALIKEHAVPGPAKELRCAPDVLSGFTAEIAAEADALPIPRRTIAEELAGEASGEAFLRRMSEIPVIADPEAAPGTWRLIRHDHCRVTDDLQVDHGDCTVLGEEMAL